MPRVGRSRYMGQGATAHAGACNRGRCGHGLRRYLLSGLLVCEHCGDRFIATGKNGSHYICSTHTRGRGRVYGRHLPVSSDNREHRPGARTVRTARTRSRRTRVRLIRGWPRGESVQITESVSPELHAKRPKSPISKEACFEATKTKIVCFSTPPVRETILEIPGELRQRAPTGCGQSGSGSKG